MILNLPKNFLSSLVWFTIRNHKDQSKLCLYHDRDVAKFFRVSPVTLSRQLNSNKIDSDYLHRYLICAGLITKNVPSPDLSKLEYYLKSLPIESQKRINEVLNNE